MRRKTYEEQLQGQAERVRALARANMATIADAAEKDNRAWGSQNAKGRAHAEKVIAEIKQKEFPGVLHHAVNLMTAKDVSEGFRVGFFHAIASRIV